MIGKADRARRQGLDVATDYVIKERLTYNTCLQNEPLQKACILLSHML